MKFLYDTGTICIMNADLKIAQEYYVVGMKVTLYVPPWNTCRSEVVVANLDPCTNTEDRMLSQGKFKQLTPRRLDSQTTNMGSDLGFEQEWVLAKVLQANNNLFAWMTADMLIIYPIVMSYKLATFNEARPIAKRSVKANEAKVKKMEEASFIGEVWHHVACKCADGIRNLRG